MAAGVELEDADRRRRAQHLETPFALAQGMLGLLAQPRLGLAQQLGLPAHFEALAMQVGEDGDLGLEDLGLHRRRHVVDGAERIGLGQLGLDRIGGQKQDGRVRDSGRCRIRLAVSKPSMSGMWTSSRIAANSSFSRRRKRLARRAHAHHLQAGLLEHGLERHQVLPRVVDDEDADRVHVDAYR